MLKDQMENIYKNVKLEKIPWNIETPPKILQNLVEKGKIKPCKTVELGCGTGNYVIYLSRMGFKATGVDFSDTAIEIAIKSSKAKGVDCNFIKADVLGDLYEIQDTFDFVYDWELMHHIFPESRKKYLNNVYKLLNQYGRYLSVFFGEDNPQFGGESKYRKTPLDTELYFSSENEMEVLYAPLFKIEELKTVEIEGKFGAHKAIHAFLTKRS
ncbi:MAG: class I SAM-dependent methyltransferase [Pseudomonadota bacterium]